MERLEHHIRSCSLNYTKPCYVLKLDIRSYFMSIDRDILHAKAQRLLRWIGRQDDPRSGCRNDATGRFRTVAYLTGLIVRHDPLEECRYRGERRLLGRLPHGKSLAHAPEGCGLPIGNLTSQLFSNLYLNDFDHFMKDRLRLKHYGRYVDDFYVVHNDPEYLLSLIPRIGRFLRDDAALTLHPAKTKLADARHGIAFLGSYVKPYRRYVLRSTVRRIREKTRPPPESPAGVSGRTPTSARSLGLGELLSGNVPPRTLLPAPAKDVRPLHPVPIRLCRALDAEVRARRTLEEPARRRPRPAAGTAPRDARRPQKERTARTGGDTGDDTAKARERNTRGKRRRPS